MCFSSYLVFYFYPRSPRGERPAVCGDCRVRSIISIHAPREGSDVVQNYGQAIMTAFLSTLPARGATGRHKSPRKEGYISIHAPREGSDGRSWATNPDHKTFLSTLPARGATPAGGVVGSHTKHFYPRSPRGERRRRSRRCHCHRHFYPRSPRGERPALSLQMAVEQALFLSTLPARGATKHSQAAGCKLEHFYPRSPRGERPGWPWWPA